VTDCGNPACPRKTFTERIAAFPPRHADVSWPVAHDAFAARADAALDDQPVPVAHLGIDAHRRGRPRWRVLHDYFTWATTTMM
jgi:hypothetical protein